MNNPLLKKLINKLVRPFINLANRSRLKADDFSVISSNCNGALILHDLAQPFNSPFVNLYLTPSDFIQYVKNISHYQQAELCFIQSDKPYPVAQLDNLTLHFKHYSSIAEAKAKWQARSKRINVDNLFILMTDRDGCCYQDLAEFDRLPFAHKVVYP